MATGAARAAEPATESGPSGSTPASAADIEALRQQVQSLTTLVQTLQQQVKDQQAAMEKNNSTAPALPETQETQSADVSTPPAPAASAPPLFPTTDNSVVASTSTVNANGTTTGDFPTTDAAVTTTSTVSSSETGSSLTQPISLTGGGNKSYMNISFDSVFALAASSAPDLYHVEAGDHDPQQRGFNARNAEIAIDGAVDPYFEGFANIVLKLDNDNETEIELEEAFLQTTGLPFGLQVKGGQFFAPFGRINATHPHTWDFADSPLVNGTAARSRRVARSRCANFMDDSRLVVFAAPLRRPEWSRRNRIFIPQPGRRRHFLRAHDHRSRTDRGSADFVFAPRWENSFNLSDTQTILVGVSGAFGSNDTGPHSRYPDLRRRSALQMEELAGRGRIPVCEMADRSHVSPLRSGPRPG